VSQARRELKEALAAGAGDGLAGDHATADELAAYHAGELPPAEEARVQDHLLRCEECTELLLDLDALQNDPGFGSERPAPAAEIDAVWSHIRAQEPPRSAVPSTAPPALQTPRELPRRAGGTRWLQALAAALLVAVAGLSVWVVQLRSALDGLSQPQVNAPVTDLTPGGPRNSEGGPVTLRLPPGVRVFTLVLNPSSPREYEAYGVTIERADGGAVWSGDGLEKNAFGSFSVAVPRSLVPDSAYRIRLWGQERGHREPLGEYSLIVAR
jgi:hypothetical protein